MIPKTLNDNSKYDVVSHSNLPSAECSLPRSAFWGKSLVICLALLATTFAHPEQPTHSTDSSVTEGVRFNHGSIPLVEGTDIHFRELTNPSGLSQTRVHQIVEDNQGFIWFGTQYGLDRYDGHEFKVFLPDPRNLNSLSCAYIHSLFKDRAGFIWVGCDQFLDRFDPSTETFTHYEIKSEGPSRTAATVNNISQDRAGGLWLSTGDGVFGFDPNTGRLIHHFVHDTNDSASISSNDLRSVVEDHSGNLWVLSRASLERLDRVTGSVRLRLQVPETNLDGASLFEDHLRILWIVCNAERDGGGIAALDLQSNTLTKLTFYDANSQKIVPFGAVAMIEDQTGTPWFATDSEGVCKLEREPLKATCYRYHANDPDSIAENRVIALANDRQGNLWAGFHARAPNVFSAKQRSFHLLLPSGLNVNKPGERIVNTILAGIDGDVWVGVTGSLVKIDLKTGHFSLHYPRGPGTKFDPVALAQDSSGMVWIGTVGQGIYRFDPKTGAFRNFVHQLADPASLSSDIVVKILIDRSGAMWLATWNGLGRFNQQDGRFATFKRTNEDQPETYYDIQEDGNGKLWLGSRSGLSRFDPADGRFTVYQHKLGDPTSISDNIVTSVHIDRSGAIWAATESGLNKLNQESGKFSTYFTSDGLPSNRVECILGDDFDRLWISTNRGISRFDPASHSFKNFSVSDGLPGMDFTGWLTCDKGKKGRMYFGGFSGATVFSPADIADDVYAPPVLFTDFRLFGQSISVGADSILKKSIGFTDKMILPHTQNSFSVGFSTVDDSNPLASRFRYKLDPLEKQWNYARSEQSAANYSALPPGRYLLRVQAMGSQSTWGIPGASLQIDILPPWWETWWFKLVCAALLYSIGWAAFSYRSHRLSQQFEMRLEERTNERTRIARDLHDTLLQSLHGLLFQFQAARNLLPSRLDEAVRSLDDALSDAKEALAESRNAIQGLRSKSTTEESLAPLLLAASQELAQEQNGNHESPKFDLVEEGERRPLSAATQEEVSQIALEILRNAYRHAQAHRIEVEIHYGHRALRLRIRDDGRGIHPTILRDGAGVGHWGLRGIGERAERIGAKIDFWSEAGAGTEAQVEIPASIAYEKSHHEVGIRLLRRVQSRAQRSRRDSDPYRR